ncbi:MAG: MazG nucleotide pyrophosphohydrolase domain-containing protein [Nanoarchaeota archaeon]
MKETFGDFVESCKKSIAYDPWTQHRGLKGYADEIKNETDELIQAIENNDVENLKEELGDILLDWIHTALIAEKEHDVNMKEVIELVNEKLNRRKPYILQERHVSKEEAQNIWANVKKWEKQ